MPFNIGFGELLVVLVVALLVFGGRLPQVGRSLGQGFRQFKRGLSEDPDDLDDEDDGEDAPPQLPEPAASEEEKVTPPDPSR